MLHFIIKNDKIINKKLVLLKSDLYIQIMVITDIHHLLADVRISLDDY